MVNPSLNALSAIARVTPSLPQRGRQPKEASPLTPNFDLFFRCMFTAMLYGARVDRPRAPVTPTLSNLHVFYRAKKSLSFNNIAVRCNPFTQDVRISHQRMNTCPRVLNRMVIIGNYTCYFPYLNVFIFF